MGLFGPNIKKLKRNRDMAGLVAVLEKQTEDDYWEEAIDALVELGDDSIEPLIAALSDGAGEPGQSAGPPLALCRFGNLALEPILQVIREGPEAAGPPAAVALARLGDDCVGKTIGLVRSLSDASRRKCAVAALQIGGLPRTWQALEELVRVSREDVDPDVRQLAGGYIEAYEVEIRGIEERLKQDRIRLNLARFLYTTAIGLGKSDTGLELDALVGATSDITETWSDLRDYYSLVGLSWQERQARCPEWSDVEDQYADFLAAQTSEDVEAAALAWIAAQLEKSESVSD